ncbi:CpaF family protein [Kiloniella majae]|uniref:CpaF family protein n=1 Tax=Kiloniella majae TaxID=1938558 RepID=UPI000A277398|nr:CpaF family protein [Kiloniella majae]
MQQEHDIEQVGTHEQNEQLQVLLKSKLADKSASSMSRPELSLKIGQIITEELERQNSLLNLLQRRSLITNLINWYVKNVAQKEDYQTDAEIVPVASLSKFENRPYPTNKPKQQSTSTNEPQASSASDTVEEAKSLIQPKVMDRLDISAASKLPKEELSSQLGEIVGEILFEDKLRLNAPEKSAVIELILADMLGLGPLEPLLADEGVTDIMVNGPNQVYIEKGGKLHLTEVTFRDNDHVMNVARRIVAHVGRRVDETTPLCDARLADGSRVNIIIPPLAIDGSSISIRKFAKQSITLDVMKKQKNISPEMATVMKIASRSRLNILISGGTGSGKTTLLNALSQMIDHGERIVTIEDAAELQLQQPHVVRLETRPPNLEGEGAITMRDLVKNSLRMRPDRIILGEIRGSEAVDMLQAMNTGHDGSLGTVHANRPREALTRLENMVGMAGINLPAKAVRTQIADALDMIIQVSRMRDGMRRITHVTEIVGMEGDIVTTQDLFTFNFKGEDEHGNLTGEFKSTGLRPYFFPKAEYFSLGKHLMDAMG